MSHPVPRPAVYAAIDGERAYQEMRKNRDGGKHDHSVEEYLLYMQDYLTEAVHVASRTWGESCTPKTLDVLRKVLALGVACMETHGAPQREGFEHTPDRMGLAEAAGIAEAIPHSKPLDDPDWASRRAAHSVGL